MNKKKVKFFNSKSTCFLFVLIFGIVVVDNIAFAQDSSPDSGSSSPAVLLISIDGLKPDYVEQASELGLDIPNLHGLWENGAYATGARGVLPSITYPSHTTIITGVSPEKHGIIYNQTFNPLFEMPPRYYWFAEDIRVPTLWEAAAQNGYKVAGVSWPVSVGADDIHFNIPEFAVFRDQDDVKMTRGFANPVGLMTEIEKTAGQYLTDHTDPTPRDWSRVRYAEEIMVENRPSFLTIHLTSPDGLQHRNGPFAQSVLDGIEEIDKMLGRLTNTFYSIHSEGIICIVSDHGFSKVNNVFKLYAAFVREGLITLESAGNTIRESEVKNWIAMPVRTGASASIHLKDPEDRETYEKVKELLERFAATPEYGIASILNKNDIARLGGTSEADFWIDMKPGHTVGWSLNGPLFGSIDTQGQHGYSPDHCEMDSAFIIAGKGIKKGFNIGRIDMRNIAPTLAKVMQVPFPSADLPALDIFEDK